MAVQRRLRPLGVGDIFDEVIRFYRNHFLFVVATAAVVSVPIAVLQAAIQIAGTTDAFASFPQGSLGPEVLVGMLGVGFVIILLWLVAYLAMQGALAHGVSQDYVGGRPELRPAYGIALRRFLALLGGTILYSLILGVLFVTIIGIPVAVWLGVRWSFFIQAIVLERRGPGSALNRSYQLVKGSWWRVFGILILLAILQWVLSFMLELGGGIVVLILNPETVTGVVASNLIGAISGMLTMPLWLIGVTVLYYDLRVRKEGFDLELLAGQTLPPVDSLPPDHLGRS